MLGPTGGGDQFPATDAPRQGLHAGKTPLRVPGAQLVLILESAGVEAAHLHAWAGRHVRAPPAHLGTVHPRLLDEDAGALADSPGEHVPGLGRIALGQLGRGRAEERRRRFGAEQKNKLVAGGDPRLRRMGQTPLDVVDDFLLGGIVRRPKVTGPLAGLGKMDLVKPGEILLPPLLGQIVPGGPDRTIHEFLLYLEKENR